MTPTIALNFIAKASIWVMTSKGEAYTGKVTQLSQGVCVGSLTTAAKLAHQASVGQPNL